MKHFLKLRQTPKQFSFKNIYISLSKLSYKTQACEARKIGGGIIGVTTVYRVNHCLLVP